MMKEKNKIGYKWYDAIPLVGLMTYPFRNEEAFNPENNPSGVLVRQGILMAYNFGAIMALSLKEGMLEKLVSTLTLK